MDSIIGGFLQTLAFLVTGFFMIALVALCYYLIKFLKNQTELTELRIDREKKEIDLLDKEKRNSQL